MLCVIIDVWTMILNRDGDRVHDATATLSHRLLAGSHPHGDDR